MGRVWPGMLEHLQRLAARRIGCTLEEYKARVTTHQWCYRCRRWRLHARFGPLRSRRRDSCCIECRTGLDLGRER